MKTTIEDALVILFRGQSNVRVMATDVGISLEEMQQLFREYVAKTPVDPRRLAGRYRASLAI
jgi:hypothetical protein